MSGQHPMPRDDLTNVVGELDAVSLAKTLGASFASRVVQGDRTGDFMAEKYAEMHDVGYTRLALPVEYGGGGASFLDMIQAQEQLAIADPSAALVYGQLLNAICFEADNRNWPEAVFAEVCRDLIANGGMANNCAAEPGLGSISRGALPGMVGVAVPGGWELTGCKTSVTGGPALRYLITAIRLPPSDDAPDGYMARAIVRSDSKGLRIDEKWQGALSLRSCGNSDVLFDRVFVPDNWVVERHEIIDGRASRSGVNGWQVSLATVFLGIGQSALLDAVQYATSTISVAAGGHLAERLQIQQWLGMMDTKLSAARAVLHDIARTWTEQPQQRAALGTRIDMAKHLCTHAALEVTQIAMRVAGALSLTRELPFERHLRDAQAGLVLWPADDMVFANVGRAALGHASASHVR